MKVLKSIGAVLAGMLVGAILSLAVDVICHATGIYPPWFQPMADPLWVVALAYRLVFNTLGSFITARLAPSRPAAHVIALAVIGIVSTVLGVAAIWNKGPDYGPGWFHAALVISVIPTAWAGYRLAVRNK